MKQTFYQVKSEHGYSSFEDSISDEPIKIKTHDFKERLGAGQFNINRSSSLAECSRNLFSSTKRNDSDSNWGAV